MSKKGLGRGLSSLLPDDGAEESAVKDESVNEIRLSLIEPDKNQPRKYFDPEKLGALSDSIKENGLIQPIVITPIGDGRYKIIAGERRWRAAKKAGLDTIPAIIKECNEEQITELALIENLQREDLNPIEEAFGYKRLMEKFSMTQEKISEKVGKSRSSIANTVRLLALDEPIQELIKDGQLSPGHARAILSLEEGDLRLELAKRIVENSLNVRQAEALAKNIEKPKKKEKQKTAYDIELDALKGRITSRLGTKVDIKHSNKKGKIEIEYYGNEDLERILSLLNLNI